MQVALSLGVVAAALLSVRRVQLYGDALFVKQPGNTGTSWHTDMEHVPLKTNSFVTLWIPLQPVPAVENGGSPLIFADGSQRWDANERLSHIRSGAFSLSSHGALQIGDATAHHGQTMHAAPALACDSRDERWALTLSYFGAGATKVELPAEDEDRESYRAWVDDIPVGHEATHPLLPEVPLNSLECSSSQLTMPQIRIHDEPTLKRTEAEAGEHRNKSETVASTMWLNTYRAMLLADHGLFENAQELLTVTLSKSTDLLGPGHPIKLTCLSHLGTLLQAMGKEDAAVVVHREALEMLKATFGFAHLETLACATNLGLILRDQGQYAESEELFRLALKGRETALGPSHRDTMVSVYNLADVLKDQCKWADAEVLFRRELAWCEKVYGEDHDGTHVSRRNLARLLAERATKLEDGSTGKKERESDRRREREREREGLIMS
eukprot:TRINITY_DN79950_c0_g1_i1.p1 TRINITY_DN79950_c0_g1~~TRINITY_DN79950_c0_g1_i1.p1  ORF type:complete len:465 (-),score=75.26 TRINITY_DN79950_c0_g1_i1:38-1354(-)